MPSQRKQTQSYRTTAAEYLVTLELYLRYQRSGSVAYDLNITPAAVRNRLHKLGVKLRPPGHSSVTVEQLNGNDFLQELQHKLRTAPETVLPKARKYHHGRKVAAADKLATLQLYLELQSIKLAGRALGITERSVANRLQAMGVKLKPRGNNPQIHVRDLNPPEFLEGLIERLQAEVAQKKPD